MREKSGASGSRLSVSARRALQMTAPTTPTTFETHSQTSSSSPSLLRLRSVGSSPNDRPTFDSFSPLPPAGLRPVSKRPALPRQSCAESALRDGREWDIEQLTAESLATSTSALYTELSMLDDRISTLLARRQFLACALEESEALLYYLTSAGLEMAVPSSVNLQFVEKNHSPSNNGMASKLLLPLVERIRKGTPTDPHFSVPFPFGTNVYNYKVAN